MSTQPSRGFTIIETMLFLAISGVLVVAMVAGTGASINIQRYRDAVETFKATLQEQYAALSSVQNDRDNTWSCTNDQAVIEQDNGQVRGQSDCMLLGRYVSIVGGKITTYAVVGVGESGGSGTDIAKLKANYRLNTSSIGTSETSMEWGTELAWPRENLGVVRSSPTTPRSIGILFIRSPDSGQIYTFTTDTVPNQPSPQSLSDMIVAGRAIPGQSERTLCIESNGLFVTADRSIFISAYATGPSSIETRSNDFIATLASGSQGAGTKC